MASKKTVTRRGPGKRLEAKVALDISRRAKHEVATLLKLNQAGSITSRQFQTRLEEVDQSLKRLLGMIRHLL